MGKKLVLKIQPKIWVLDKLKLQSISSCCISIWIQRVSGILQRSFINITNSDVKFNEFWIFVKKHEHQEISTNRDRYFEIFGMWDYEILDVPAKKTGKLMVYRGKKVLLMVFSRSSYNKWIIAVPLKNVPQK